MVTRYSGRNSALFARLAILLVLSLGALTAGCRVQAAPEATGTEEPLSISMVRLPFEQCGTPRLVGSTLFTSVSRGYDQGMNLVRYDLDTNATEVIVEAEGIVNWIAANEEWLVWSASDQLFVRAIEGSEIETLTATDIPYSPSVSGDLMAWDYMDEAGNRHMSVLDLRTRENKLLRRLQTPGLYNHFSSWDGQRLVWTDIIDDEGWYFVWDAVTDRIEEWPAAETDFPFPGYAVLRGDRIYSLNFDRLIEPDWTSQQLGCFSPDSMQFDSIAGGDGVIVNAFEVTEELLVYQDSEHRLHVQRVGEEGGEAAWLQPIPGLIDFTETALDGSIMAWQERPSENIEMYFIKP